MGSRVVLVAAILSLVVAGCSGSSDDPSGEGASGAPTGMPSMDMGHSDGSTFGQPGDPSTADITVEITQLDSFAFEPSDVEVKMGETVTFAVTNGGQSPHEFVLGDDMVQQGHESEMQEMGGELMPDEPYAITVQPGETGSLTWTFTEAGSLQFGCHMAGHFAQGMVGTIDVMA